MKKLRKIISLMLVCAMAAVLLAGCGGEPSTSSGQEG